MSNIIEVKNLTKDCAFSRRKDAWKPVDKKHKQC